MYAELRGNNQGRLTHCLSCDSSLPCIDSLGLIKLVAGTLAPRPAGEITVTRETGVSAMVDGGQRVGMVIMRTAVDLAIQKAKNCGMSVVGVTNYASATGALGMWGRDIARNGLIGMVFSQVYNYAQPNSTPQLTCFYGPLHCTVPRDGRAVRFLRASVWHEPIHHRNPHHSQTSGKMTSLYACVPQVTALELSVPLMSSLTLIVLANNYDLGRYWTWRPARMPTLV